MTREEIILVLLGIHGVDRRRIAGIRTEDLIDLLVHPDDRVAGNALYVGLAHPEVDASRLIQAAMDIDRKILSLTLANHAGDLSKSQARTALEYLLRNGDASVIKAATRTIVTLKMSDLRPLIERSAENLTPGFQDAIKRMLMSLDR